MTSGIHLEPPSRLARYKTAYPRTPHVLVPPVLADSLQGPDIEEVVLLRDETANMAWAIERKVTGPAGYVVDRYERWRSRLAALVPAEEPHDRWLRGDD